MHQPAVVGIDVFPRQPKTPDQDFPLMMAFAQTQNLVLVNDTNPVEGSDCFSSINYSHPDFNQYASNGFANVYTGEKTQGFRTIRTFIPQMCVGNSMEKNFTLAIASFFDSSAVADLVREKSQRRGDQLERTLQ